MSRQVIDLTGKEFGSLTALARSESSENRHSRWKCLCVCGKLLVVRGGSLPDGPHFFVWLRAEGSAPRKNDSAKSGCQNLLDPRAGHAVARGVSQHARPTDKGWAPPSSSHSGIARPGFLPRMSPRTRQGRSNAPPPGCPAQEAHTPMPIQKLLRSPASGDSWIAPSVAAARLGITLSALLEIAPRPALH